MLFAGACRGSASLGTDVRAVGGSRCPALPVGGMLSDRMVGGAGSGRAVSFSGGAGSARASPVMRSCAWPAGPVRVTTPSRGPGWPGVQVMRRTSASSLARSAPADAPLADAETVEARASGPPSTATSATSGGLPGGTRPRSMTGRDSRTVTPSSARAAAADTPRLSSSTRRVRALRAAAPRLRFAPAARRASSPTAASRPADVLCSTRSSTSGGSGSGMIRRCGLRAMSRLPWTPNSHLLGVCRGETSRTRS